MKMLIDSHGFWNTAGRDHRGDFGTNNKLYKKIGYRHGKAGLMMNSDQVIWKVIDTALDIHCISKVLK